jgi:adhesin transport system membrane fusion protein
MKSDFAFANNIRAALALRTPRASRLLLYIAAALFGLGLVWANFAILDEVKRGNGRVVPSQQIQVVQTLEGGLIEAILVREGTVVRKGDPLVRVDDTGFASQFGEVRERRAAMAARVARLAAEADGSTTIAFPDELSLLAPRSIAAELAVFEARGRKQREDQEVLRQQTIQKQSELEEYKASEAKLKETHRLIMQEVQISRKLYGERIIPEIEMIRANQKAAEASGQLDVIRKTIPKAEAAVLELQSRSATAQSTFRAQAEEDLAKSRGDLAVLEETIRAAQDRVRRTELKSPVYGIINRLNITTIGAVVQPGAVIMDIVPLDDTLLVEARIRPQDIAFIRPGQDAVVKVTAYDPYVYGSLSGKVERISADASAEDKAERGETFYRVMVRTDRNHIGRADQKFPIIPGMVTTVEVLTGRKSILDYILKPARMLREEALREH